jgi:hypothetical protein
MKPVVVPSCCGTPASRTVYLLPVVLLAVFAVADATPLEPLHLKGIQDGGDYDSLIQPLVLVLAALPESPVSVFTPIAPSTDRLSFSGPAVLPLPARRGAPSRAPPVL